MKKITVTKPRFMRIFAKRLIISLVIFVLLGTAVFLTAQRLYRLYAEDMADRSFDDVSDDVGHLYSEYCDNIDQQEAYNYFITTVNYTFRYYDPQVESDVPVFACRLINKNGEVLCTSDYSPMLKVYDKSSDVEYSKPKYYNCHPDVQAAVHSKFIEYDNQTTDYDPHSSDYKSVMCTKAYISGRYFYPRLSLCRVDSATGEWKELEGTDFYPEDTSSLKLIEDNESTNIWYEDYMLENYDGNKEKYRSEKAADEFADGFYVSGDDWHIGSAPAGYIDHMTFVSDATDDTKGESFILISVYPCSLFERYGLRVILTGSAMLLLAVCISLFTSLLTYKDKKAQYEIFTARRETTNAMAHDLKVPLTAMSGYCEMLREDIDPQKRQHYLDMISSSAEQMNRIVTDILELAKTESDVKALDIQSVSVREVCTQIVRELDAAFEKKSMKCTVSGEDIQIKADRQLFTQAVTNLMHNALVYSKQGSEVSITIDSRQLRIENTPESMPKTEPDELMKAFVKGDSFRGENSGSGVGLAVAKHDMQRMGFTLTIELTDDRFAAVCRFK